MSRAKITVLTAICLMFYLPAMVLLWTAMFGAYHQGGLVITTVMLFVIGLIVGAVTLAEME